MLYLGNVCSKFPLLAIGQRQIERWYVYFVNASLFRFNKLWPTSAPFSLAFINPSDWRVGNTGSRPYIYSISRETLDLEIQDLPRHPT